MWDDNNLNRVVYNSLESTCDYIEENHPELGLHEVLIDLVGQKTNLTPNNGWVNGVIRANINRGLWMG